MNRSIDNRVPLWLRVVACAVERVPASTQSRQFVTFGPGELRGALEAEGDQIEASLVTRAIRTAERNGFLEDGSSTRCLIVAAGSMTTTTLRVDRS